MNTEQRIRLMIGDLIVSNADLMAKLEECQKEIEELKSSKKPKVK